MQKALLGVLIAIALAVGLIQLIPGAQTESVFDFDEVSGAARELSDDVLSLDQDPKSDLGNYAFHGHFVLTAYEWTGAPCANGAFPTVGYTVACNSLPLGTRVYVDVLSREGQAEISVKNISAEMLGVSTDELLERFGGCEWFSWLQEGYGVCSWCSSRESARGR